MANTTEIAGNSARERQRSKIKDDTREENEKREERKLTTDSGGYTHPRIYNPLRYDNKRMFSYIEIYLRILPTLLFLFVKTFIKEKKLIDIKISFFLFIRWDRFFQPFRCTRRISFAPFRERLALSIVERPHSFLLLPRGQETRFSRHFFEQWMSIIFFAIINVSHSLKCY